MPQTKYPTTTNVPNLSSISLEIIQSWVNYGFTYSQIQDWLSAGLEPHESSFAAWLRYTKKLTPEEVINHGDYQQLRQEFQKWQYQSQVEQRFK